jgi:transcriptional regulatory protein LevR
MVAGAAIDAANLAVNPHARQAAHDDVEKNAKLNPVVRSAKAFLDPVTTGYGIASQVKELMNSTRDAKKSEANYQAELQKRKARKQSGALAQQSKFRSPPMQ